MRIQADAIRSDGWWAIDFTVEGATYHTQARTLEGIEPMVRDALDLLGIDDGEVVVTTPYSSDVERARRAVEEADRAAHVAQEERRDLVRRLRAEGLSLHDVGKLMGVSYQRVSQLAA